MKLYVIYCDYDSEVAVGASLDFDTALRYAERRTAETGYNYWVDTVEFEYREVTEF